MGVRNRFTLLRLEQQPPGMSRLTYLARKFGKMGLYHKLALRLHEQLNDVQNPKLDRDGSVARVGVFDEDDDEYEERIATRRHRRKMSSMDKGMSIQNAMRTVIRKFPPAKMFLENDLNPRAPEIIIMNARRWTQCKVRHQHGIQQNSRYGTVPDFCYLCGWNKKGYLLLAQERYDSVDINLAAKKLPSLNLS